MIPRTLDEWTLEVIRDLLAKGYYESEYFDFKQALPHSKNPVEKEKLEKNLLCFC
jgi:hypothetical protein